MRKKKVIAKVMTMLLSFAVVFSMMPGAVFADWNKLIAGYTVNEETAMTDEEAIVALTAEFDGHNVKNPIEFPYGTGENQYTNVKTYIEDRIKALAPGKNVELTIGNMLAGTTSYTDYAGSGSKVEYKTMDEDYNITPVYSDGVSKPALTGVVFKCGDSETKKLGIYFAVQPVSVTDQEIVDFEARQLVFNYIKGKNTSADYVNQPLGVLSGTTVGKLPEKGQIYSTSAKISWSLESVSGNKNALVIASNKVTVNRPEVGEEDAVFKLVGTVYKSDNENVSKSMEIMVTVPAYKAIKVPVKVNPADAALTIKSGATVLDDRYIEKRDNGNYILTLHGTVTDGIAEYDYTAEKEGYITTSGKIKADPKQEDISPVEIEMKVSSADDTALENLEISSPAAGSASIITPMETFEKDRSDYTMKVTGPVASVTIKPVAATEGATVKARCFNSAKDAAVEKITSKAVTSTAKCYLKDFEAGDTVIEFEVTAPASSTQSEKTRVYTVTVSKNDEKAHSLKSLGITYNYTDGKSKNTLGDGYTAEAALSPALNAEALASEYRCEVNYYCESVTLKPAANAVNEIENITVAGNETKNNTASEKIVLKEGSNLIPVAVTKTDGTTETYNINVFRKPEIGFESVTIEAKENKWEEIKKDAWTGSVNFPYDTENLSVKFNLNGADYFHFAGETKQYKSGETVYIGDSDKNIKTIYFCKVIDEKVYAEKYVISFIRMANSAPTACDSYLPAPGQFVNLSEYFSTVSKTVAKPSGTCITLGAFGGNVVYYFDEGITDDPKNPYGIDFIVYGNVFANSDGSSAAGASEPAAVMVSEDGNSWYELAGSEYYSLNTERNISITYTNPDSTFSEAASVPWKTDAGESGYIYKNDYHKQAYYPKSSNYSSFQNGVTANSTYSDSSVTFKGTRIDNKEAAFGYADCHYFDSTSKNLSSAVNPYRENHLAGTNADGFDLSWAVDENGAPVKLSEVHYVKVYTAMLKDGGSTGEVSSEISGILRADQYSQEVGKTAGLKKLTINGQEVEAASGKVVSFDAGDAESLTVTAEASDGDNIYINNKRAESGMSVRSAVTDMVRIIVQSGQAEPTIYYIKISGENTPAGNAELDAVTVLPGDVKAQPDAGDTLTFTVANNVERVAFLPETMNHKAAVEIEGKTYNSGETSDTAAVSVGENTFSLKVTSENGEKTKLYKIKVIRENAAVSADTITVYFSLAGDLLHGENGTHSPVNWIERQSVNIPKAATVKYITELMLNNRNIPFVSDGVYISSINGIFEFDNGSRSGWMYRHNGKIADVGYAERTLKNGDTVEWFYTDDYTKETGYEGNWDNINEDKSQVTTSGSDIKTTTTPTEVKVSGNTAAATVTDENAAELVKQAKENKSAEIVINVSAADTKNAETINLELDKKTVESIVKDTDAVVTVKTPTGEIGLDKETLKQVAGEASGNTVTIEITRVSEPEEAHKKLVGTNGQVFRLAIKSGNKVISDFKGTVTVRLAVPAALKDKNIAAVHIEGSALEKLEGKRITQNKVEFYEFKTDHFSEFALVDTTEVKVDGDDNADGTENIDKAKSLIKELKLRAVSSKTAKKNIKVTVKMSSKDNALIKELSDMGYTVKYKYYRSVKKASKYTAVKTKTSKTYINTKGKRGSKYYYKVRAVVYDGDKAIAQSALKQCKYAVRKWSK